MTTKKRKKKISIVRKKTIIEMIVGNLATPIEDKEVAVEDITIATEIIIAVQEIIIEAVAVGIVRVETTLVGMSLVVEMTPVGTTSTIEAAAKVDTDNRVMTIIRKKSLSQQKQL